MSRKEEISREASVIITGASSGIGRSLAVLLAKKYAARLVLNGRRQQSLEETARLVRKEGGQARTVIGDVADRSVTSELVRTCFSEFAGVDILINNAGFAKPGPMQSLNPDDWRRVFEVNFFAGLELIYQILPYFLEHKSGKIVNISSVAGKVAFPGSVCYATSKFALTGLSEGMASEFCSQGIDVITVCPGLIRTEFFKNNNNPADITEMAQQPGLSGWLIKNVMSISAEAAAREIIRACELGGSREIILTGPGKFVERLAGICPPAAFALSRLIPSDPGRAAEKKSSSPVA